MPDTTAETLELLKQAQSQALTGEELAKATFNQPASATVGLQIYNLEIGAKQLYPLLTPLRNMIPRVGTTGGTQANWKAVTGIDTGLVFPGVAEGRRGGVIAVSTAEYFAAFRTLGMEGNSTFEAQLSSEGFDDVRARAARSSLEALMLGEERLILGGSTSYMINGGTACPTPTLTTATTGGSLGASASINVYCVPLTMDGKMRSTVAGGVSPTLTVNPAEGGSAVTANGGVGKRSAVANITTGGTSTNTITAKVTNSGVPGVRGAWGYAWYWGTTGNELLGAITDQAQVVITATATGTQNISAIAANTDWSKNDLVFDGLLTMAANPANNSYFKALDHGAGLTSDGTGGIVEFDEALAWFWDNLRLGPTRILIGTQEVTNIRKKVLAQPTTAANRFTWVSQQGQTVGGGGIKGYLNPYGAAGGPAEIPFMQHPYMPKGTVLFICESLPYALNNVTNVMQVLTRKDYYQMEWPLRARMYEYGVYMDGVLQHYFMPSLGIITNIANA